MKVLNLAFREMGSYSDMPIRPFVSSISDRDVGVLAELTDAGRDFSVGAVAGFAGRVIRPASETQGIVSIDNGWGTSRFMFIMEVEVRKTSTSVMRQLIVGMTDNVERISRNTGNIDQNTVMHFMSSFTLNSMLVMDSRGANYTTQIRDQVQWLTPRYQSDYAQGTPGSLTQRPRDIVTERIQGDDVDDLALGEGYIDMRNGFVGNSIKANRRQNNQANYYLSRTLEAIRDSSIEMDFIGADKDTSSLTRARSCLKEPAATTDPVLSELAADTNIMQNRYVTYGELCAMNPGLDSRVITHFNARGSYLHQRGDTRDWNSSDPATIAATIIANALPTIMLENMYSKVKLITTNQTPEGTFQTATPLIIPFSPDILIESTINQFLSSVNAFMMPDVLSSHLQTVYAEIECEVYGNTTINISLDGEPLQPFVFPTWADTLISPVVTEDRMGIKTMAASVSGLATRIIEANVPAPQLTVPRLALPGAASPTLNQPLVNSDHNQFTPFSKRTSRI